MIPEEENNYNINPDIIIDDDEELKKKKLLAIVIMIIIMVLSLILILTTFTLEKSVYLKALNISFCFGYIVLFLYSKDI